MDSVTVLLLLLKTTDQALSAVQSEGLAAEVVHIQYSAGTRRSGPVPEQRGTLRWPAASVSRLLLWQHLSLRLTVQAAQQ